MNTDFLYGADTLALLRRLLREPSVRILTDTIKAAFCYETDHIAAEPEEWMVETQDSSGLGGACLMAFTRADGSCAWEVEPNIVLDGRPLDEIWIVRMGLHFSASWIREPSVADPEELRRRVNAATSAEELRALSSSGLVEYPCHPDDPALAAADPRFAYVVDTGIIARSGPNWIKVFSDGNSWTTASIGLITDEAELEAYRRDYQWVAVESGSLGSRP